jgi:uncharacterized protein YndB with AHSA1/START domain
MTEQPKQYYRVMIDAPLETVWDILTKEGEVLPFFFGSVLHTTGLRPGAPIRMRTPDNKYTGVVGEVLEFEPPHRYSHTFRFTNLNDPPCKVSYLLRQTHQGVEFTLITEAVPAGTKTEKSMAQGGPFITETIKALAETGKPPLKSRMILGVIAATRWMTPACCKTEHWPMDRVIGSPAE